MHKKINLEAIDPVIIYGVNNSNLEKIKKYFPKIKIIARGQEIKAIGGIKEIQRFEEKINLLITHYNKYNSLTSNDIERLMLENGEEIIQTNKVPDTVLVFGENGKPIKARTVNQRVMVEKYNTNDLIFAIGPAGSGKTYVAMALAVRALRNKEVKRIILSRPAVEAGEHLGFLPGDLKEKLDPYLQPLYDALNDMIPSKKLAGLLENGTIQIAPLAFMRGRTLNNAVVILDEAQNASLNQLKMYLTRMGNNVKFIVTGDVTQIDLPNKHNSGLLQARQILKNINGIAIIHFDEKDIIRHKLVKYIVEAYEKNENNEVNNE